MKCEQCEEIWIEGNRLLNRLSGQMQRRYTDEERIIGPSYVLVDSQFWRQ